MITIALWYIKVIYLVFLYVSFMCCFWYCLYQYIINKNNLLGNIVSPYLKAINYSLFYLLIYTILLYFYLCVWYKVLPYYLLVVWLTTLYILIMLSAVIVLKKKWIPLTLIPNQLTFSFLWSFKKFLSMLIINQPYIRSYLLFGLFLSTFYNASKKNFDKRAYFTLIVNMWSVSFLATPLWAFFIIFKWLIFFKEFVESPLWARKTKKTMFRFFCISFKDNYYSLQYSQYINYGTILQDKSLFWMYTPDKGIIFSNSAFKKNINKN